MIRAGLRRILVILAVVLGGTAAVSAALGALAGGSLRHALALGYYLVGVGILIGSLALGSRGPTRVERDPEGDRPVFPFGVLSFGRRKVRKATHEERREAKLASLGLFAFGALIILLGAVVDPARRAF